MVMFNNNNPNKAKKLREVITEISDVAKVIGNSVGTGEYKTNIVIAAALTLVTTTLEEMVEDSKDDPECEEAVIEMLQRITLLKRMISEILVVEVGK